MTIEEAIAREIEMAEMHRNDIVPKENYQNMPWVDKNNEANMRSAEEHEQLAEWLEELSRRRVEELFRKTNEKAIRDKAIDNFQEWLKTQIVGLDNTTNEILVAVDDRWELAIDKFKERVSND